MRKQLARLIIRKHDHPMVQAARAAASRLGLKGFVRLLFAGDLARRTVRRPGDPADPVGRVNKALERIAGSSKPVIVGPWLSEVGFELLYWIPFLHWAVKNFNISPQRITVVSRGGARSWYGTLPAKYVDIFGHYSPREFRARNEARRLANGGLQKQTALSDFDRAILGKVSASRDDVDLLHPELMYLLFDDFWQGKASLARVAGHTDFVPLAPPAFNVDGLPAEYTAVRFYERPSFPMTAANIELVRDLTAKLAGQGPVVFLSSNIGVDEHRDFATPDHSGIVIPKGVGPQDNLLWQSAITARASKVYCTYGGFSYLPLFYRVPAVGLYSADQHFYGVHGPVVRLLAERMETPLAVVRASEVADLIV